MGERTKTVCLDVLFQGRVAERMLNNEGYGCLLCRMEEVKSNDSSSFHFPASLVLNGILFSTVEGKPES